ncbi:hypothetical protein A1O1_00836 [Capronia coronata CBS 617.96]|uniref:BTB domain-containing protein n=1 Tax=Capronia coronata CBS 617.96 TaxID=1182541 RepID=W9YT36_9EURO|nr:uncharacterized protein A1O1_00836 [Capronia coronata CBS 617.96]EXJ95713.1 hypothetical protein A1O1_00836 [Capronia coronata CBS 617.96]
MANKTVTTAISILLRWHETSGVLFILVPALELNLAQLGKETDGHNETEEPTETEKSGLETFGSPLITLLVGPQEMVLTAHKAILTQCEYFSKCLDGKRFQEGVDSCIKFPEDDPKEVLWIIQYLYTGKIFDDIAVFHNGCANLSDYDPPLSALISRYATADKYCLTNMCKVIQGTFVLQKDAGEIAWAHLEQLIAAGLRGSGLCELILDKLIEGLRARKSPIDLLCLLNDGLRSEPEIAMEIMEGLAATIHAENRPPVMWENESWD